MPALVSAPRRFPQARPGRHSGARTIARLATALVVILAVATPPGDSVAQSRAPRYGVIGPDVLTVTSLRDLTFGTLERGFSSTVSALDVSHAALFEIQGPAETPVRIELVLPVALESAEGARVLLVFGPSDGFASVSSAHPPAGAAFNPRAPLVATLGPDGRLHLRIGGTARPDRLQAGGTYRAAIFVSLYNLGS